MTAEIERDEQLPDALVDELKRIDHAPAVITSRVDRTLSTMARTHFSSRRVRRWRPQAWAPAAACALIALIFAMGRLEHPVDTAIYADVDGSGAVDIADVLALARSGQSIDQGYLDAFAFRLVALDGPDAP